LSGRSAWEASVTPLGQLSQFGARLGEIGVILKHLSEFPDRCRPVFQPQKFQGTPKMPESEFGVIFPWLMNVPHVHTAKSLFEQSVCQQKSYHNFEK